MKMTRILCTLLLFGPLAVEASEATDPKGSHVPSTVDSATGRDTQPGAKPVNGQVLAQTATEKGTAAKDRNSGVPVASRPAITPHGAATPQQVERANGDRLRTLLATQARGRVVRKPGGRRVGPARAPTFMDGAGQQRLGAIGEQLGATPTRQVARGVVSLARVASPVAARPVPTLSALAIHSTSGLPRAPGLAVVGGPVMGNNAHNSSIDGTRLRHKF